MLVDESRATCARAEGHVRVDRIRTITIRSPITLIASPHMDDSSSLFCERFLARRCTPSGLDSVTAEMYNILVCMSDGRERLTGGAGAING